MTPDNHLNELTKELLGDVVKNLSDAISTPVIEAVTEAVKVEVENKLSKALTDGELYRRLTSDMQGGFKDIYEEIKNAKGGPVGEVSQQGADELINKASNQLDAVLKTTEKAAVEIIDIVENLQEMSFTVDKIVKGFESGGVTRMDRQELKRINSSLGTDLQQIMVTLSFQDLTGQRIKIIIESLKKIESIVQQNVVATGLKIKTREEDPDKAIEDIEKEVEDKTTKLHGPSLDADQNDVDDLLAQFGL